MTDTILGSVIAYVVAAVVLPVWEHEQIDRLIKEALEANRKYFNIVASMFTGEPVNMTFYKLYRKDAFVALANLSDAFQRMLSEPKNKQMKMEHYHQFVATNIHLLLTLLRYHIMLSVMPTNIPQMNLCRSSNKSINNSK